MELYTSMLEKQLLTRSDTLGLASMLHTHYRINHRMTSEERDALLQKFQKVISDLKHGRLQPHPVAHVHIISYFKESKQFDLGEEYWRWLVQQDETQLDARTYGSVIELLAYRGESLPVLEEMYTEALKRFPGQFSEYHLSPGAILADPKQATFMAGTRMFLLQGILTARVLLGDWRNAYLALDTALRLYPTQVPSRFYELFIYERPVTEAYRIFLIACRCETPPSPKVFIHLLESLARSASSRDNPMSIPVVTNGMLNALHAYIGSDGKVNEYHINTLANHILELLPPRAPDSSEARNTPENDAIFQAIITTFHKLLHDTGMFNSISTISTYNNMITIGGKKRRQDLIDLAWSELIELRLQPNNITFRVMLLAGGYLGDADIVKGAWEDLKTQRERSDRGPPDRIDWKTYARAGKKTGLDSLITNELPADTDPLSEQIRREVVKELKTIPSRLNLRSPSSNILEEKELLQLLETLNSRLAQIKDLRDSHRRLDFYHNPLPISLSSPSPPKDESLRDLYNKLSRDPALIPNPSTPSPTSPSEQSPAATTTTGFPLDELRFQNWSAINDSLIEAEQNEKLKLLAVDRAIASGKSIKWAKAGVRGQSGLAEDGEMGEESLEEKILRLRGHVT